MRSCIPVILIWLLFLAGCGELPEEDNSYHQEQIPWPSLADSPWPMNYHDPQGTNRSQYVGPQIGEVVTIVEDSVYMDANCVIGDDNSLYYIGVRNGTSILYKRFSDGTLDWKFHFEGWPENYNTPLITSNGKIYVQALKNKIYIVNRNGLLERTITTEENINTDIGIDKEGNLYFITQQPNHILVSLNPEGENRWTLTVPGTFTPHAKPFVFSPDGSIFYATSLSDSLYAITTDGIIQWSYPTKGRITGLMVDNDGHLYFVDHLDSSIVSLYSNGEIRWQTGFRNIGVSSISGNVAPTLDAEGNIYFYADFGGQNGILSLDNEGNKRWVFNTSVFTHLVSDIHANIYFAWSDYSGGTYFNCLTSDGILKWEVRLDYSGNPGYNPAIGSNGYCYFPFSNTTNPIVIIR